MAEIHYFNTDVAAKYGVNCAVVLQNLWHWVQHNKANDRNFHDGHYWTYNSTKAFTELFPYLSQKQIETALKKLRDDGIIITGNYNETKYDRTLWYAITEKGESILHSREMDITDRENGFPEKVEPIPDSKPSSKTPDVKNHIEIIEYLNSKAGTRFRAATKSSQQHISARMREGFTVDDFKEVIDKKCAEWKGTDWEQYLRPATLFGSKFEGYLNAPAARMKGATGIAVSNDELDAEVRFIFGE